MSADSQNLESLIRREVERALRQAESSRGQGFQRRWLEQNATRAAGPGRVRYKLGARPWHLLRDGASPVVFKSETIKQIEPRYSFIPQARDPESLYKMLKSTTARLGVWRAGSRPLTRVALDFLADHAIAKRAVYHAFADEQVRALGLIEVKSQVRDKDEFLLRPDLGRILSPESAAALEQLCLKTPDVQIVVSDGLSGIALDVNIKELLAELSKVFAARGYRVGTPVYCRFARVALQDQIGYQLQAKACVILIGERPGLGTGDGLSAYLIYKPTPSSTHANRNCISNIHPRGLEPPLAAKLIEFTVTRMFEQNTSGVDLDLN